MYKQQIKPQRTDAEWEAIKFKNSLGPQIGGLLHDAVAIVVAELNLKMEIGGESKYDASQRIKYWLDTLYEIAEQKKIDITTTDKDKANKDWDIKKQTLYNESSETEDINKDAQLAKEDENN